MNPTGYTLSYRSKWEHPVFKSKQEAAVWAWMCDVAQWKDTRIGTKFGPVEMRRGELIIAERSLAEDFGMHRNTLRSLLQRMADDGMISLFKDRCPHRAGTIVKIENYERYQAIDGVANDAQDRKPTEARTEAGPKEDRSGTKNNTVNTVNTKEVREESEAPPNSVVVFPGQPAPPAAPPTARPGSRISPEWFLPKEWGEWALEQGLTYEQIRHEADVFRDYWVAKAGKDGRKADWLATWRNWVRRSLENQKGNSNYGQRGNAERPDRNGYAVLNRRIEECRQRQTGTDLGFWG